MARDYRVTVYLPDYDDVPHFEHNLTTEDIRATAPYQYRLPGRISGNNAVEIIFEIPQNVALNVAGYMITEFVRQTVVQIGINVDWGLSTTRFAEAEGQMFLQPPAQPRTPTGQGTTRTAAPAVVRRRDTMQPDHREPPEGDIWRAGNSYAYILSTLNENGVLTVRYRFITDMAGLVVGATTVEDTEEHFLAAQFRYYGQGPRVGYEANLLGLAGADIFGWEYIVEAIGIALVGRLFVRLRDLESQESIIRFAGNFEYRPHRRGDTARRNLASALQNAGEREPQQVRGAGNNFPTFFETGEQRDGARMLRLGETLTKDDFLRLGNFYIEKKLVLRNFEVISDDCDLMQGDKLYPIIVNKSSKGGKGGDPWRDNAQVYCLTEIMDLLRRNRQARDPFTQSEIRTIHIMTEAEVKAWEKKIIRDMSAQGVQAWKERLVESKEELEKEFKRKKAQLKEEKKMLKKKEEELEKEKERMKLKRKRRSGGDGSGAGGDLSTSRPRFQALKL